ncbi:MAG: HEPN domain-containing protein [Chloroflexia bacterium]|nr:HEPN domain-containing protein [Chloroflexia bacterium]
MSENEIADSYLRKAADSLAGAESECANRRFSNCANRAYYAAFQAAIAALVRARIRSRPGGQWPHAFVQAEFAGKLINRNRRYPAPLRSILPDLQILRTRADYHSDAISEIEAQRGPRRSRAFFDAIRSGGGNSC